MSSAHQFDFDKIKHVSQRTQNLMSGYVREIEKELSLTIPDLITVICIFYYYHFERFTTHGVNIELNKQQTIATKKQGSKFDTRTVYGAIGIDLHCKANKYVWTFKILSLPSSGEWSDAIYIGIDNSNKSFIEDDFIVPEESTTSLMYAWGTDHYKYSSRGGTIYSKINWKNDDIIGMELDINKKSLTFYLNGVDQGIAFENVNLDYERKYHMAVGMLDAGTSIELISFEEIS